MDEENPLHISSLNHVSLVCKSVEESTLFYRSVLGFVQIRRPGSLKFPGSWLLGYGVGIHLLESESPPEKDRINPREAHISFQCESVEMAEKMLTEMGIDWVRRRREEEGRVYVDQLFFHDPDGFMIEIYNRPSLAE